ncbi:helicase associated domain-containing protein [Streptomyces sp. PA03-6a]|nr:helicase associated domain-containing protein [Streptomyces sp. PA03-6a]
MTPPAEGARERIRRPCDGSPDESDREPLGPAEPSERPPAPRTQADKWAVNLRAARQFHAREGALQVPRKHVEQLIEPDGTVTEVKLGQFVDNARRRAGKLTEDRRAELDALGMRW